MEQLPGALYWFKIIQYRVIHHHYAKANFNISDDKSPGTTVATLLAIILTVCVVASVYFIAKSRAVVVFPIPASPDNKAAFELMFPDGKNELKELLTYLLLP